MASSVNKVILVGNLGKDPEVNETKSGTSVCSLSIATTSSYKDKKGEWQEKTEWHRVTVWGKRAESCGTYLSQGRQVYVEGRLETRKWQDKDGNDRYTTEIVASDVQFLGGKSEGSSKPQQDSPKSQGRGVPKKGWD